MSDEDYLAQLPPVRRPTSPEDLEGRLAELRGDLGTEYDQEDVKASWRRLEERMRGEGTLP